MGWSEEGLIRTLLLKILSSYPSQRSRKLIFLFFFFFFNSKDLFDCAEICEQENSFLLFFFQGFYMSQAAPVSKPAEFYVTRLFPCS